MKPTTDLFDDHETTVSTCSTQFRDFGGKTAFYGPIRTVRCSRDNQLFRALLDEDGGGAVVVVDGGGSTESALMGDLIAAKGAKNGWAGVVILGAIRDATAVGQIDIGVKALGVNPAKSAKLGDGDVDAVLAFGGVTFTPGQWIYCDEDGVLVSPDELDVS
ncbi:MAG: ribonuclease E activity regulator RraA [Pseudomonadota bacterium]